MMDSKSLQTQVTTGLAMDANSVSYLNRLSKQNKPEALKQTAKQFEAIFINMMLQSMHKATPQSGLFEGFEKDIYTSMLDQQLSQTLAQRGMGLADMILKQLNKMDHTASGEDTIPNVHAIETIANTAEDAETTSDMQAAMPLIAEQLLAKPQQSAPVYRRPAPVASKVASVESDAQAMAEVNSSDPVDMFCAKMTEHANIAADMTGIPAEFILAQAGMESGWGKHEIIMPNGYSSHNLFGIKAGSNWKGAVAEVATTEYMNGTPRKVIQRFRAYDSHADAFRDYASLLSNNQRYEQVLNKGQTATGFAQALQQSGYATDPTYANKIIQAINQVQS